jgi:hypothetical protein
MKKLVRATAVAIGVGIGIVSFGGVAHAWDESASASSACVGDEVTITVTFTNGEPSNDAHAMVVSASDEASDKDATWGNGQSEITVPGGTTVTGTINTHSVTSSGGSVRITERWANGNSDHDSILVDYEARDCTPSTPASVLGATTQGVGGCDTTTGGSFVDWSVTNTGEIGVRAVDTDLTGGVPDTLIGPGETLAMPKVHAPGSYQAASYTVDVEATDGRTSTVNGNLAPALTGACTVVTPLAPPAAPAPPALTSQVMAATKTAPTAAPTEVRAATALPNTGSAALPLGVAGFTVLALGLCALSTSPTGLARARRLGIALRAKGYR